jgi:hypothetical protein
MGHPVLFWVVWATRLLGQVVTVSVDTVRLVRELAELSIDQA